MVDKMVLLLQEFYIKIKDKKGLENVVVDHLQRLENPELEELKEEVIDDNFPDECLMVIEGEEPWFVDILNYLIRNYPIKGLSYEQKKKLFSELQYYFCTSHISSKVVPMGSLEDVFWGKKIETSYINAIVNQLEDIMELTIRERKCFIRDSFGLPYSRRQQLLSRNATHVKDREHLFMQRNTLKHHSIL